MYILKLKQLKKKRNKGKGLEPNLNLKFKLGCLRILNAQLHYGIKVYVVLLPYLPIRQSVVDLPLHLILVVVVVLRRGSSLGRFVLGCSNLALGL